MLFQGEIGMDADAKRYSCLFNVIASFRDRPWTVPEYNEAWRGARAAGIISGDLNADGDYDDVGEDEIKDFQGLFDFLKVPLLYVEPASLPFTTMVDGRGVRRTARQSTPIDLDRYAVAERWVFVGGHFLRGDGTGDSPPIHDPVRGGSRARQFGRLESLRVWRRTDWTLC